ncbi:MAG: PDZ domain-containing protein, partial [Planctomycetota bacterium]
MRTRVSALPRARRYFLLAAIAAAGIFAAAPASAQVSQSSTAGVLDIETSPANLLRTVLDEGIRLETQDRWGEALAHYEEALREHPNDQSLLKRQDLAKLHYSLDRRYDDRSFRQSLAAMTPSQALGLYAELLRKVNAHYVDVPPWQRLGVRAVAALDVALQDPEFRSVHRLSADRGRTDALRSELYQLVGRRLFSGPSDLVTFSSEAGRLVEQRVGAPQTSTILEFVTAAAGGLDDYSAFLTADQLRDVYSQIEGNFVGLGVELKADSGALLIVHVIPGSPAERAGIRDGDRIVAVDGKSTAALSTDEAAALLTGEEGSVVQVTVASPGRQPRMATVRREHVEVTSLEDVEIADADFGVAYVRLPAFQKTTARDLEAALWDLHRQGMRSLVLDLRGNPGAVGAKPF